MRESVSNGLRAALTVFAMLGLQRKMEGRTVEKYLLTHSKSAVPDTELNCTLIMYTNKCVWKAAPRQVKAVRHTGKVINQAFLQEQSDDVVHAIVLRLGSDCAVKTGGRGTWLHNGADDAHHCLKSAEWTERQKKKQIKLQETKNADQSFRKNFAQKYFCILQNYA